MTDRPSDKPLTDITFDSFDLHPRLLAGLELAGFTRCTPIQAMSLPVALKGGDVAGQAQTGTGKTLAFLVATINRLLTKPALADRNPGDPRALILAPTRELAIQIHKDAVKLGPEVGLTFALVYGGVDYDKQRELLQKGVDVIIATPGRLIDYVKQHKVVSLHACEVCVLDEADRMFDLGFIKDIRFLLRRMPACTERQTLLFSATLSHRVLELAYEHMNEPEKLVVESEYITASQVRQLLYFPADEEKIPLLLGLLSRSEGARTMVFVNTKVWVERVARALEKGGYRVGVLSGDVPQKKRESLLAKFQKGQLEVLVATDVAARGLHIDGIKYVYNYDLPFDAEDYVHRIGRTARLGEEGDAISFACERYAIGLPDIEAYIEQKIPSARVEPELLIPLPRPVREKVAGEEEESVGAIFKEAREARAAEEERRGGGRSRSGEGGGRGSAGRREGGPATPRRPRREHPQGSGAAPAPAAGDNVAAAAATVPAQAAAVTAASSSGTAAPGTEAGAGTGSEPARAPRKRRRRRGGRKIEGQPGEAGQQAQGSTGPAKAPRAQSQPSQRSDRSQPSVAAATAARPAGSAPPAQPRPAVPNGERKLHQVPANKAAPRPGAAAGSAPKPGLLGRIGKRLKSLVGGDS
ncbi:ATP-dependent RNA helicase RhlB [Lysobacter avium]|uniref:ATP-dependent RNA helicase RhlB n=1 Tax=Novilysobacter avium TaxID=2781023 RepID=A0A7S6ZVG8_9GAMM|nr:ATP-dependent RNA helicase RhlB [Lysobacter avium]